VLIWPLVISQARGGGDSQLSRGEYGFHSGRLGDIRMGKSCCRREGNSRNRWRRCVNEQAEREEIFVNSGRPKRQSRVTSGECLGKKITPGTDQFKKRIAPHQMR